MYDWSSNKYWSHEIRLVRDNQTTQSKTRMGHTWKDFGKLNSVFKWLVWRSKVFNKCVLPVLTFRADTKEEKYEQTRIIYTAMKRSLLLITLRDTTPNKEIWKITGVLDAIRRLITIKWNWAGHVARRTKAQWTRIILEWRSSQEAHRIEQRTTTNHMDRWNKTHLRDREEVSLLTVV